MRSARRVTTAIGCLGLMAGTMMITLLSTRPVEQIRATAFWTLSVIVIFLALTLLAIATAE